MTAALTGPLGRRQLDRLKARLSERDQAIIGSVAVYRFLTARQIERLHFPIESHHGLGAVRASRRALERLYRLGVLRRLDRRVGGVRAGSAGFVYCLGPIGVRMVESGPQRSIAREPSAAFLQHLLATAAVVVQLIEASRTSALELVTVETEPACWRRFHGIAGAAEMLKPDLYVVLALGDLEIHAFIEVDRSTEHRPVLARKAAQYERYLRSGHEQQRLGIFPTVAWLVPDEERRETLIDTFAGSTPGLFSVGLQEQALHVLAGDES